MWKRFHKITSQNKGFWHVGYVRKLEIDEEWESRLNYKRVPMHFLER